MRRNRNQDSKDFLSVLTPDPLYSSHMDLVRVVRTYGRIGSPGRHQGDLQELLREGEEAVVEGEAEGVGVVGQELRRVLGVGGRPLHCPPPPLVHKSLAVRGPYVHGFSTQNLTEYKPPDYCGRKQSMSRIASVLVMVSVSHDVFLARYHSSPCLVPSYPEWGTRNSSLSTDVDIGTDYHTTKKK